MVKYGKEFRKNQKADWKDKYFDYKAKKQKIRELMREKEGSDDSDISYTSNLEKWSEEFQKDLDKDIKKVYIFFSGKERILYKQINESLHLKNDDEIFNLKGYTDVFKHLKEISDLSLQMSYFIYYNLKAVIKILKKYDKKIVTPKHKDYQIRFIYIQTKIEEQNSDILYLIKFKMIDEVNLLLENIISKLMKEFKSNKDNLEEENEEQNEGEAKLIEEVPEMNNASKIIKDAYSQIKKNIQETDKVSARVQKLFMPWKDFLKISTDINSKFLQITRESNVNFKDTFGERTQSLADVIGFSKDSKYNIFIILAHGFLYMFSFSVIIPTSTLLIYSFGLEKDNARIYWAILMMMAPLGTLFNYLYETFLFKKSTKKPLVISCIGLILGNVLYMIAQGIDVIELLFVGRFICGLFNLRTHNKMYIINFLTKKDISFYLTMFHTTSTLGLAAGFLVNAGLLSIESENEYINMNTIGSLITIILSFILLVISFVLFTEAHSNEFNITSMQMFGEGIINDDDNFHEGSVSGKIKRQTTALKDIDSQLGNFNKENRFDDTNLVSKNVSLLALREEERLHYLMKDFFVYLLIIFTTKFINESIFVNSYIFLNDDEKDKEQWLISVILGGSCILILLVELSLSRKYKFISERNLIIILLCLLLIINILFIIFNRKIFSFYFLISLDTILASITEKYTAHLFLYIMPENYIICRINGNVFISIFSMVSRIICCALIFFSKYEDIYNYIVFIVMTLLSLVSFIFYIIFYKEIRIKAINRILTSNPTDEIKIATEV